MIRMKRLSIALLSFLLLASVGISGWAYGPNLIPNPNFDGNLTGWCGDATWLNDSGNGVANVSWISVDSIGCGYGVGDILIGEYYYWSFIFKSDNDSALIQTNMDGASDIYINATTICDNNPEVYPEEGCIFPTANYIEESSSITPLGNGWYKFETTYFPFYEGGLIDTFVQAEFQPTYALVDDVVVQKLSYSCGWNCSTGHMIVSQAPLIFGLMVIFTLLGVAFVSGNPILAIISASVVALFGTLLVIVLSGLF